MKLVPKSPLQRQVMALKVCTRCHSRTLVASGTIDGETALQCSQCLALFIADEPVASRQSEGTR